MYPKVRKYTKKKKKSLLIILLYFAILLFIIWLLVVLALAFLFWRDEIEGDTLLDKVYATSNFKLETLELPTESSNSLVNIINFSGGTSTEKLGMETCLKQKDRDEFKPVMKDVLNERDLTFKNTDMEYWRPGLRLFS